jgi:hypothetical protein
MNVKIFAALFAVSLSVLSCSNTRKTVKADPQSDKFEPMRAKTDNVYNNTPGSQNREISQDALKGQKLDIKE